MESLADSGAQKLIWFFSIEIGNEDQHWRSSLQYRKPLSLCFERIASSNFHVKTTAKERCCLSILVTPTPNTLRPVVSKLLYRNNQPLLGDLLTGWSPLQQKRLTLDRRTLHCMWINHRLQSCSWYYVLVKTDIVTICPFAMEYRHGIPPWNKGTSAREHLYAPKNVAPTRTNGYLLDRYIPDDVK